jgi:hypothetical protein
VTVTSDGPATLRRRDIRPRWRVGLRVESPLRHQLSHLRHAHRVCRVRRFWAMSGSGSTLWVARRVCDRHPHARHDRGRVWAGHKSVAQQRVSPCKRLANTSGPRGCGSRRERLDACDGRRGVPSPTWGHQQRRRPMSRCDEFALSTHRGSVRLRAGRCRRFHAGWGDAGRPTWLRSSATRMLDRRRAPDAVGAQPPRARPPHSWRMICARVLGRSAYSQGCARLNRPGFGRGWGYWVTAASVITC